MRQLIKATLVLAAAGYACYASFVLGLVSAAPQPSWTMVRDALSAPPFALMYLVRLFDADALPVPREDPPQAQRATRATPAASQRRPTRPRPTPTPRADAAAPAPAEPTATAEPFAPRDVSGVCKPDRQRAEREFADLNRLRAEVGLSPLAWDESLYEPAVARAMDMASRGYFSHYDPVTGAPLAPDGLGEVAAMGSAAGDSAAQSWRGSPPHWENISSASMGAVALVTCTRGVPVITTEPGYPRERYTARMIAVGLLRQ